MADADLSVDQQARDRTYHRFLHDNLRRNSTAHFIHGMLGLTGFRLLYAPTFIPAYIHELTGSVALVGLGGALLQLGGVLTPIVGATRIEHRPRILPYAIRVGSLMRVQILGLALAGWFLGGTPLLIATMAFFFLLGLFTGSQRVAFQMLMAKVIPIARRGRLQAWRNLAGGTIAAALSYWAGDYLIGRNVFGNGYATTFFVAFVLTSLGLAVLRWRMVEPDPPSIRRPMRFTERVREFPVLFADRDYCWFMVAQALTVAARVSAPFYVVFAGDRLGLDGETLGLLSVAFLGADTVSNLLWGTMGDRFGFRSTFVLAVALWIASVATLLLADGRIGILVSFCGLGAAIAGYQMSATTMVLEFGHRDDVAMRLAVSTTLEGSISAVGPLLGGLVAALLGLPVLLSLSLGFLLLALAVLLLRVNEPRDMNPSAAARDHATDRKAADAA